jgi:hypothetical protein
MQHIIDEFAAKVAQVAVANLSPEVKVHFRDYEFGGKSVTIELRFAAVANLSDYTIIHNRDDRHAQALGEYLADAMKREIREYAATVCTSKGSGFISTKRGEDY